MKRAQYFINQAIEICPDSSFIQFIAARLDIATGRLKEAQAHFKKAMKIDESSIETMNGKNFECKCLDLIFVGLIYCQLLRGETRDAALQLELLDELLPTIGLSAVSSSVKHHI